MSSDSKQTVGMSLDILTIDTDDSTAMQLTHGGIPIEQALPFSAERVRQAANQQTTNLGRILFNSGQRCPPTADNDEENGSLLAGRSRKTTVVNDRILACSIICVLGVVLIVMLVLTITLWNRVDSIIKDLDQAVSPFIAEMVYNVRASLNSTRSATEHVDTATKAAADLSTKMIPQIEDLFNTTAKAVRSFDAMATNPTISLSSGRL